MPIARKPPVALEGAHAGHLHDVIVFEAFASSASQTRGPIAAHTQTTVPTLTLRVPKATHFAESETHKSWQM
jgi:hypothetical protein